jgi:hypothetical protein
VFTAAAFLAVAIQCFIIQTHVHSLSAERTQRIASHESGADTLFKPGLPGKYDPSADTGNCPLCVEILSAGHFLAPAAIAFALPDFASIAIVASAAAQNTPAASHAWQGRAPPRA